MGYSNGNNNGNRGRKPDGYHSGNRRPGRSMTRSGNYRRNGKTSKKMEQWKKVFAEQMPENYPDLYPQARMMERHFVLHLGPTNSGKTYSAMEVLKSNGCGAYFGPLRLLAFEQYEKLNAAGCVCDLITGEEERLNPGATFQASTIEILDPNEYYQFAVVDEAQLIADPFRGDGWTAAILGLQADEIHVCASPNAKNILIKLIEECGDTWDIVEHERLSPISYDSSDFHFPENVEKGDALIAFSKKEVLRLAQRLQQSGKNCSVIYGALPYDVREEEARRFLSGETDIVVSTDAIGMGLNLPVRRVVFTDLSKFDGVSRRFLYDSEIQQIAGRAGRKGLEEIGYYTAENKEYDLEKMYNAKLEDISRAVISFPTYLINTELSLKNIFEIWSRMRLNDNYKKKDFTREEELLKPISGFFGKEPEDKKLMFRFIQLPFDEGNESVKDVWIRIVKSETSGRQLKLTSVDYDAESEDLEELEKMYKIHDLMYVYFKNFGYDDELPKVMRRKLKLSSKINKVLKKRMEAYEHFRKTYNETGDLQRYIYELLTVKEATSGTRNCYSSYTFTDKKESAAFAKALRDYFRLCTFDGYYFLKPENVILTVMFDGLIVVSINTTYDKHGLLVKYANAYAKGQRERLRKERGDDGAYSAEMYSAEKLSEAMHSEGELSEEKTAGVKPAGVKLSEGYAGSDSNYVRVPFMNRFESLR